MKSARIGLRPPSALLGLVTGVLLSCAQEEPSGGALAAKHRNEVSAGAVAAKPWNVSMLKRREVFDPASFYAFLKEPYVLDPYLGLVLAPDHDAVWKWSEHPKKEVRVRTNNRGLLEDVPTLPEKRGSRILVAGDSHMMVVSPDESFPNVLEESLRAAGHAECEALCNGVGYTGPRLYLRRLERFLDLAPDVFIVSFFTGNDFWDDLQLEYDIGTSPRPALDAGYAGRLERCKERFRPALFQGLNQAHWFKHWPGTAELAFELALASLDEIRALCARKGMLFLVVLLPTKFDVDHDEPRERAEALATLELTEEEASIEARLAERLAQALAGRGVPCIAPREALRASPTPSYWRTDHHLSVAGHARVAEAVFEVLHPLLAEREGVR